MSHHLELQKQLFYLEMRQEQKETDGPRLYGKVLVSVKLDNTPQARTGCQSDLAGGGGMFAQFVHSVCVLEATFGNFLI